MSSTIRTIPVEVKLGHREELASQCVLNCDNIRTVARPWLGIAHRFAGPVALDGSEARPRYALAWNELIDLS
jgi:mRNA-degrading endonuclease toxin of MazEF toxin-antitoxin module